MTASYRDRTVLVTGHTGFKGAWLALWLKELGARVAGLSLPEVPGDPSFFRDARIADVVESHPGDLRDGRFARFVLERVRPEIVFHLAAQAVVSSSYRDPVETFAVNVMGTAHLLEAVRQVDSVQVVVAVTSDKCYDNREWDWAYREVDPLGGRDPYSASKACQELVTSAYRSSFFAPEGRVRVATARAGNVIGGGDWAEHRLVPDLARATSSGRPAELRSPNSVRPWQHVFGPLEGYLTLGARLSSEGDAYAQAWNFGPPEEPTVTVLELARMIADRWPEVSWELSSSPMPEARQLRVSSSKARARLAWRSRPSLEEGVRLTVDWYRAYAGNPAGIAEFTRQQLRRHLKECAAAPISSRTSPHSTSG
ncbi:MAG: CDP-glucose 4,6-dehydratase [Armatimonadetes bacterium]|nr:CDP-glucose 4,6-dehydratase [Armatimonadota bacterium]